MQVGYAKISILNECLALRPITASTLGCISHLWLALRVLAHQAPRVITYSARPTKRCLALYTTANRVHDSKFDVTPKITEQNRIVRTGKYEAEVTNNID